MAFFKALTEIGIDRAQLAAISDESLIRIEKKLVAAQKLNNTISKNDVEQALRIIKDYPDVLKEIARYDCLYGILTGYDAENIDTLARYTPEQTERIKLVVSDYFTDELAEYINLNIGRNNWNNIRVLLHYSVFLNNAVIKMLTIRLEAKVEAAIGNIQQQITHDDLRNKFNYLRNRDFYFTLGEVNKQYFLRVIVRLVDLLKENPGYASESSFFREVKIAMRWYDVNNRALANKLGLPAYQPQGVPVTRAKLSTTRIIYIVIVICSALFNLARSCNTSGFAPTSTTAFAPHSYEVKASLWAAGRNVEPSYGFDSTRQEQKLKIEDFIEARIHPVNFPMDSLKTASGNTRKYQSPFGLDIFDPYFAAIKNDFPTLGIFNHTDKECVVIAYYREQYNDQQKNYEPINDDNTINIFPLYIPPHDSISIDCKMTLLRFYMGQRLKAFKSSPSYHYPDSTDLKFSRFTRADSLLFSKAFWIRNQYIETASAKAVEARKRKKMMLLIISQPSADTYQLSWAGDTPLHEYPNNINQRVDAQTDSATNQKPILYDIKNPKRAPTAIDVNSFITY